MLKGKNIDLRIVEKEDLAQWNEWWTDPEFHGQFHFFPTQTSKAEREKSFLEPKNPGLEFTRYFIQKKDGTKVGIVVHFMGSQIFDWMEIGYAVIPGERGKGYAAEAAQLMVDYLFLNRNIERIQAHTIVEHGASQKVLLKAGFKREGVLRRSSLMRGKWRDDYLFSITREDWGEPHILQG
jgi:RimJ/RimL family protein N-acetyltransferase